MEGVGHHLQSQEQQLCLEEYNGVCVCCVVRNVCFMCYIREMCVSCAKRCVCVFRVLKRCVCCAKRYVLCTYVHVSCALKRCVCCMC